MKRDTAARSTLAERRSPGVALSSRALLVSLVVALTVLAPAGAFAISRTTVLSRAQSWVDDPVRYSQSRYHRGYRTDCSGYVSMCWATGTSWSTRSFYRVTHSIRSRDLQPGDAMLKKGYHIRLFYAWLDNAHTSYVAYESGDNVVSVARIHSLREDLESGYVPTRYDRIGGTFSSRNLLRNGTFNTWVRPWGESREKPVWWQVTGIPGRTLVARRQDVYRGAHNSLKLLNPGADPGAYTELSQVASVTPGWGYQLRAWARTPASSSVEMQVECLDAAGGTRSEMRTSGRTWGIGGSAFSPMSVSFVAPPGATGALVTLRLAGATTLVGTATVTGTSVYLDDVTLMRPQSAISVKHDVSRVRSGEVVLYGSVTPTTAVGQTVIAGIKRPGQDWEERPARVFADGPGGAGWRCAFRPKGGLSPGVYQIRAKVPESAWYAGAASSVSSFSIED